jgi:hypothetical protein
MSPHARRCVFRLQSHRMPASVHARRTHLRDRWCARSVLRTVSHLLQSSEHRRKDVPASVMMNRPTSGHCRVASMAMSCGHGRASRWSRLTRSLRLQAEQQVESCEYCHPDDAEILFDRLLAEETGKHGPSEFMLTEPARSSHLQASRDREDPRRTQS